MHVFFLFPSETRRGEFVSALLGFLRSVDLQNALVRQELENLGNKANVLNLLLNFNKLGAHRPRQLTDLLNG